MSWAEVFFGPPDDRWIGVIAWFIFAFIATVVLTIGLTWKRR